MSASDKVIDRWLDRLDPAFEMTPRQLAEQGREADVLETLSRMDEGVFG